MNRSFAVPARTNTSSHPLWRLGLGLAICGSQPAWAAETNLGNYGQTKLQQDTGDAVQFTCGGFVAAGTQPGTVPLFDTCRGMVHSANELTGTGATADSRGLSADEVAASLQQIATEEFGSTESLATEINGSQTGNILSRLVELRSGSKGLSLAGLSFPGRDTTLAYAGPPATGTRGGAAGADAPGGKFGGFLNGRYGTGDRDGTTWTNEFDFDSYGLTGGVDYRFTPNFVMGVALTYQTVGADFTDNATTVSGGSLDADSWGGFFYGTYYTDNLYVDALAGYTLAEYDTKRRIIIPNNNDPAQNIDETAKGSPDSDDFTASLGAGYTLGDGALSYGPYARLTYYRVDIDSYRESGAQASGLNLDVHGQDWTSFTSALGGQVSYAASQSFGVLVPQLRAGWIHEFENDAKNYSAVYVDDPNQNLLLARSNSPDRDYFEVGLSVSAVLQNGAQAFVAYDTLLGLDDVTDHVFTVGGRLEF